MTTPLYRPFIVVALLACAGLRAAETPSIMRQTAQRYDRKVTEIIGNFVRSDKVPEAAAVLELRTIENDMLSLAVLSDQLRAEMPLLVLSQKGPPLHDLRSLPGLLVIARARTAGLDVLQDRLQSRTFALAAPQEKRTLVPIFSSPQPSS